MTSGTTTRRYPLSALVEASGLTEAALARKVGLSGSTLKQARERGFLADAADRYAVRAGLHPYEVWPEMHDHHAAQLEAEDLARMEHRRRQWRDANRRKRLRDPEGERIRKQLYAQEAAAALRVYKRRWNEQNAERVREHSRSYRARQRAARTTEENAA